MIDKKNNKKKKTYSEREWAVPLNQTESRTFLQIRLIQKSDSFASYSW